MIEHNDAIVVIDDNRGWSPQLSVITSPFSPSIEVSAIYSKSMNAVPAPVNDHKGAVVRLGEVNGVDQFRKADR